MKTFRRLHGLRHTTSSTSTSRHPARIQHSPRQQREPWLFKTLQGCMGSGTQLQAALLPQARIRPGFSAVHGKTWLLKTVEGCMGSGTQLQALLPRACIQPGISAVRGSNRTAAIEKRLKIVRHTTSSSTSSTSTHPARFQFGPCRLWSLSFPAGPPSKISKDHQRQHNADLYVAPVLAESPKRLSEIGRLV